MKVLFFVLFFASSVFANFYIINGEQKVKMTSLSTGKIDFSTFGNVASVQRGNSELNAYGDEIAFNHRHLNFRLATIGLTQSNFTITEWSEKADALSEEYFINFADYTREDGIMLQLFYKNRWYAVVLGNPLEILQTMFLKIDVNSQELDVDRALEAIGQARIAFASDERLRSVETKLRRRHLDDLKNRKTFKRETIDFKTIPNLPNR